MRKIFEIAKEIKQIWKKPYFGAVPYLDAMCELETIDDNYYFDTAETIINYFLANATYWRGADARRIKSELKELLKKKGGNNG